MGVGVGRGRVIAVPHQCLGVDRLDLGPGQQGGKGMTSRMGRETTGDAGPLEHRIVNVLAIVVEADRLTVSMD